MADLSLQEERPQSPSSTEEFDEEGHEVEGDDLVPIALVRSVTTTGNENDNAAGSLVPATDDSDALNAEVAGGGRRRKLKLKSPCETRRNKLVALLAGAALVVIVALSAGLIPYFNNKGEGNDAVTEVSAAMAATDGGEEEEVETDYPTPSPTTSMPTYSPTLPMAGSMSNDFAFGDERNVSNDSGFVRERRLDGRIRRRRQ